MDIMLVHCVFFSLNELDLFIQVVELMLQIFNHILYTSCMCICYSINLHFYTFEYFIKKH